MSEICTPDTFNYIWFYKIKSQKRKKGNPKQRENNYHYKDILTAFDIETTKLNWYTIKEQHENRTSLIPHMHSIMYVWQWQFGTEYTVIGRTWLEFTKFQKRLQEYMQPDQRLCVYVHNLSYEFQFLRGIYDFSIEEVFALKSRKILKCNMYENKFEFRCSYLHSNMGLDEFTHKMGAEHSKLSGHDFNYKIKRYPWTTLSDLELSYCQNDVLGLVEALTIEMNFDGDNLYSIPITSTGYVRRDAKKAMRETSQNYIKSQLPDYKTYQMLHEAFRGGNTHANRYFTNYVIKNVKSDDRSSSYPDVQCNCKFPTTKFIHLGKISSEELLHLIRVRKKAVLMRIIMTDIRLLNEYWGFPYLSKDKCRNIRGGVYDNGRILKADYLETTLTDIDLEILLSEYYFKFCPIDVAHSRYAYLPPALIKTTISYYVGKTSLKDVAGQELFYMKSKNKLNSIYGMSAQNPVKQSIDFSYDEEKGKKDFIEQEEDEEMLLSDANDKAFLNYAWGVWTTAYARLRLEEGLRLAGNNGVYCDTDSVKYIGELDFTDFNNARIADSLKSGAYATDPKGVTHYMGVYEKEHDMCEFKTMGAKKYVYRETPDSPLICTIAGVNKKKGGKELEKYGGITAFKSGFIFHEAGGTELKYNDVPEVDYYEIDGHIIPITSNVVISDSEYTLGLTAEYLRLLKNPQFYVDNQ